MLPICGLHGRGTLKPPRTSWPQKTPKSYDLFFQNSGLKTYKKKDWVNNITASIQCKFYLISEVSDLQVTFRRMNVAGV